MIGVIDEHHLRVGDQVWFGQFHSSNVEGDMEWKFRQFMVHFENKWMVSVIWGYCTYSDNHDFPVAVFGGGSQFNETPEAVEAGVLHADREQLQPDGEPFAYVEADELNLLLTVVSTLPTDGDLASPLE